MTLRAWPEPRKPARFAVAGPTSKPNRRPSPGKSPARQLARPQTADLSWLFRARRVCRFVAFSISTSAVEILGGSLVWDGDMLCFAAIEGRTVSPNAVSIWLFDLPQYSFQRPISDCEVK